MLYPVVMAGGTGSRLWPLSRQLYPKQFLPLADERLTMLQATLQRLDGLPMAPPRVICHEDHRFLVAEQLRQVGQGEAHILLEPVGRSTAPAIALAALHAVQQAPDALLLVLAADHLIADVAAFQASVRTAMPLAQAGRLVTFGIVPDRAETGYGYIERGEPLPEGGFAVRRFVEKPDRERAEAYVAGGAHYWNSGMFLLGAARYLDELRRLAPAMLQTCEQAMAAARQDLTFTRVDKTAFEACPEDSIDYAVMEKTDAAAVVPLAAGWSDIGSWSALWEVRPKDEAGNVRHGDVLAHGAQDCYLHAESRLVAAVGVQDLVVVETKDAVLVAHKSRVQDVKHVVAALKAAGRPEHQNHREVYRPWGAYDSVDHGARHQVKRITVKPGARLSLQMHHHRAEHWIVVRGTARVTCGDKTYLVTENQSTYIPVGEVHCLENPGVIPLEMIEVQSGSYLGEDDIVRLEDRYGRT